MSDTSAGLLPARDEACVAPQRPAGTSAPPPRHSLRLATLPFLLDPVLQLGGLTKPGPTAAAAPLPPPSFGCGLCMHVHVGVYDCVCMIALCMTALCMIALCVLPPPRALSARPEMLRAVFRMPCTYHAANPPLARRGLVKSDKMQR